MTKLFVEECLGYGQFSIKAHPTSPVAAVLVCKTVCPLLWPRDEQAPLEAGPISGDLMEETPGGPALLFPSDFTPPKTRADLLLKAVAYAPEGKPRSSLRVRWRVGERVKELDVYGDRHWSRNDSGTFDVSDPESFSALPLSYDHAFGGPSYPLNPVGRGAGYADAPNIEHPQRHTHGPLDTAVEPAGFGAISASWQQRARKLGSYDEAWLKERWPWLPRNFDWSYFNAAPEDQQLEGYLRGDEEMEFENLHPEQSLITARLPGVRVMAFVYIRNAGQREFHGVLLNLDTLFVDLPENQMTLVWRGMTPASTLKLKEIDQVFVFTEPVCQERRSLAEYRDYVRERFLKPDPDDDDAAEVAAEAKADAAFAKEFELMEAEAAQADKDAQALLAQAEKATAGQRARLIQQGVDPTLMEATRVPRTFADDRAELVAAIAAMRPGNPDGAAKLSDALQDLDAAEREIAGIDLEFKKMDEEFDADTGEKWTRAKVEKALADGRSLIGQEFNGLDLSGLDFSRQDLSQVELRKAKLVGAKLVKTILRGGDLSGCDLSGADLSRAVLDEADLSHAVLKGAVLTGLFMSSATLSALDLSGADFSGSVGRSPDFSKSNLTQARFVCCKFPQSDFSGCQLADADFTEAELQAAMFDGAQGPRIRLDDADVSGWHGGDGSDFSGGSFRNLRGAGSIWEQSKLDGADFSGAQLQRAQFSEASLLGCRFDRADLEKAVFEDAALQESVLTNANLLRAGFDRAVLDRADLRGSNFYEAGFWDTQLVDADLRDAYIKSTLLTVNRDR